MEWNKGYAGLATVLVAAFTQAGCAGVGQHEAGTVRGVVDSVWTGRTYPIRSAAAGAVDHSLRGCLNAAANALLALIDERVQGSTGGCDGQGQAGRGGFPPPRPRDGY